MTTESPVRGLIAEATRRLAAAGVHSAEYDARVLASHASGLRPTPLVAAETLDGFDAVGFRALVERRAAREPLQHIVGSTGFRHLELAVGPGVFVPRPETELVAGAAIDAARRHGPAPLVVDLCAGSAAIALAVADEVPGSRVHAVERDPAAAAWARRNIEQTHLPVTLHVSDVATALPEYAGRVAVVVANPPYVPDDERGHVAPEVHRDPPSALWGGPDGLTVIRVVVAAARRLLRSGGELVMEHSDRHGTTVPALLTDAGEWTDVVDRPDLSGRPRYVTARAL